MLIKEDSKSNVDTWLNFLKHVVIANHLERTLYIILLLNRCLLRRLLKVYITPIAYTLLGLNNHLVQRDMSVALLNRFGAIVRINMMI